jgi:hypothetical protein
VAQAAPELVRLGRTQECPRPARLFEATQLPGGGGFLVSDSGIGLCFAGFEMHTARWCRGVRSCGETSCEIWGVRVLVSCALPPASFVISRVGARQISLGLW